MHYINLTKQDLAAEKTLLEAYRKLLSQMPPGKLSLKKIRGRLYYYVISEQDGRQVYIPFKDRQLIHDLKQKRLLQKAVRTLEENIKQQEKLLIHYQDYDLNQIQKTLPNAYSDENLITYQNQFAGSDAKSWENSSFRQNPYYPEDLIHKTSFGLVVRTKSEALIAELLHASGIPFRYEWELNLRGRDGRFHHYYPDFTILPPAEPVHLLGTPGTAGSYQLRKKIVYQASGFLR